jgi:hypothetical protein
MLSQLAEKDQEIQLKAGGMMSLFSFSPAKDV